jgi:hypothetical protein
LFFIFIYNLRNRSKAFSKAARAGRSLPDLSSSSRDHPPFLLPRKGEETEEERENNHHALAACGDTA